MHLARVLTMGEQGLGCKQLLCSLKQESPVNLHAGTEKDEVKAFSGLKGESMKSNVFQPPPGRTGCVRTSVSLSFLPSAAFHFHAC